MSFSNNSSTGLPSPVLSNTPINPHCYNNSEMYDQYNSYNQENNDICSNLGENINNDEQHSNNNEKKNLCEEIIYKLFKPTTIYDDEEEEEVIHNKMDKTTEIKKSNYIEDKKSINILNNDRIIDQQTNKNNKRHKYKIAPKNINKKRKKPIFFRTINCYIQFGNKLLVKNFRVPNLKSKTLRIFIQEIIPFWVTGVKPNKYQKLKVNHFINNYKNHEFKSMKISKFISKKIEIPNDIDKDFINIKLSFTLQEAFLCFAKETSSKEILLSVLTRLGLENKIIDINKFFSGLDTKNMYINGLAEREKEYKNLLKAFSQLLEEFNNA